MANRQRGSEKRGVALLELIIYIGASAVVLIGALSLLSLLVDTWSRSRTRAVVEEQMRGAVERMRYNVENAQGILSPQYTKTVLSDGPVGYWRLGEASGTSAVDSSDNTNTGTYTGGFTLGTTSGISEADTAVTLNGTSGYVTVPDHNTLDVGDVFTAEMWINATTPGSDRHLLQKDTNSMAFNFSTSRAIYLRVAGSGTITQSTTAVPDDGAWHYVAVTKNGADVHLFLDGADVTGSVTNAAIGNTASALGIGANSSGSNNFIGSIDEVALYNKALSSERIKAHYNEGVGNALLLEGAGRIRTYSGYAWSENFGWLSFSCLGQADPWDCTQTDSTYNNYEVTRALDSLSGFARTESTGFISLSCSTSPNANPCQTADYQVTVDASGQYHGWAWGETIGWISFNCADRNVCATSDYKVYEVRTGSGWELHGWAWSDSYGWISFNCADRGGTVCTSSPYKVKIELLSCDVSYTVNSGTLTGTLAGTTAGSLTDSNVSLTPCTGRLGFFKTITNPPPARTAIQICMKATYVGRGFAKTPYSTEYLTTFQLQ